MIAYAQEPGLDPAEFIDLLHRSGLAERRPVRDEHRVGRMLANSQIVLAARAGDGALVGVARAITDYAYCCYLSDLAVDRAVQGQGIGRALIDRCHALAGRRECSLILLAAPDADGYYRHLGLARVERGWTIPRLA